MDEDECLQRITELVYDDNEIVTATFLSKILKINIHNAQSLLDKYVKNADVPDQTDLSWTFTIIGADIDAGLSISIVKQDELETVKSKLQTVLAEHVFSVQRKGDIDLVILSNIEPFTEDKVRTEPLQGSIVSKNSVKRKLRKNSVVNINEVKQDVNKVENKQNASVDVSKPKKNGIEGFLSKGSTASSMQSKPVFTPKVKQSNMMANFFTKSNSFNKTQIINEKTENEKYVKENACSHETIKETRIDVDDEPVSKTTEIHFDENEKSSQDKEDIKQVKRSKKRKSQHKGSQIAKKRKRILETADSDSDIFASSESEEVFSDAHYSDDNFEEEIKPQAVVPMKARQMKQVTEEFLDDEGFLNTVQKYIFVSGNEDEENREENNINTKFDKPIVETKNPSTCEIKKETSLRKPRKKIFFFSENMETTTVVDANISTTDVSKEDLQQQYSALSKLYTEQQVELEKKSQQIYDYKRELTRLTTLEAEYISEIECLQSGERNECERWKSKVQKLEEEKNDILNRHIQEIDNLELNLFKKDEEIVELQEQLKRLANSFNINENKDKIEGAQLMNIKLKNEVTSLSEQLVILTERIECFEKQQLVYQEQNLNLKDELNTLKENYICKKQELDEAKDLIENLQEELMSTKIELETTKSKPLQDGSQGNSIFAEVDDKRLELQERMALMKLQYLKMKQERGKLLAEISSLHSSNAMLCDRWETECNDKTEEQDRLEEAYRARIRHLEAQLETYREQIATRPNVISGNLDSDILEFLDNVVGGRNREIAKLEQEINGYSLSRMVLTEQLKESNVEMRSWRAKATKLESQVGKLQTEIDVLTLKQNSETVIDDRRTTNLCPSCIRNKRSIAPVAPSSERRLKDVVADLCRNSNGSILDDFRTVDYSRQLKRSLLKETDLNAKSTVPFLEDAKENIENERQSGLANDNLVKKVQFTDETVDNSHKGGGNLRKAGKVIYCKPMILKKKC